MTRLALTWFICPLTIAGIVKSVTAIEIAKVFFIAEFLYLKVPSFSYQHKAIENRINKLIVYRILNYSVKFPKFN
jgi:DNA helicase TIP49 (TBP-interacting protein)